MRARLAELPAESVQCVVTSPPYWGLRDYGIEAQIWGGDPACQHEWGEEIRLHKGGPHGDRGVLPGGSSVIEAQALVKEVRAGAFCSCGAWRGDLGLEPTPELYVEHMVDVFADVHRVLRPDGVLWLNLGDCYATGAGKVGDARWAGTGGSRGANESKVNGRGEPRRGHRGAHTAESSGKAAYRIDAMGPMTQPNRLPIPGLKPKDLVGIPWRVAFALQADGWWLRMDNVWSKPNPMPESITDRPTKAHEYVFLLTKSASYFYDADAIREPVTGGAHSRGNGVNPKSAEPGSGIKANKSWSAAVTELVGERNRRSVWTIATQPYPGAHFATFPEALVEPCIKAGTSEKGACSKCGAPWERVTGRACEECGTFIQLQGKSCPKCGHVRHWKEGRAESPDMLATDWSTAGKHTPRLPGGFVRNTGGTDWAQTCACADGEPIPCKILDPFAGSGTALMVALRLGREGWGIELSPKYAQLARARIEGDSPLFNVESTG